MCYDGFTQTIYQADQSTRENEWWFSVESVSFFLPFSFVWEYPPRQFDNEFGLFTPGGLHWPLFRHPWTIICPAVLIILCSCCRSWSMLPPMSRCPGKQQKWKIPWTVDSSLTRMTNGPNFIIMCAGVFRRSTFPPVLFRYGSQRECALLPTDAELRQSFYLSLFSKEVQRATDTIHVPRLQLHQFSMALF